MEKMAHRYMYHRICNCFGMTRITSLWILLSLLLFPLMTKAQDVPAVETLPLDSAAVDSGDELDELDDIDVRASQLPECLAGLFSHDTLIPRLRLGLLKSTCLRQANGHEYKRQ